MPLAVHALRGWCAWKSWEKAPCRPRSGLLRVVMVLSLQGSGQLGVDEESFQEQVSDKIGQVAVYEIHDPKALPWVVAHGWIGSQKPICDAVHHCTEVLHCHLHELDELLVDLLHIVLAIGLQQLLGQTGQQLLLLQVPEGRVTRRPCKDTVPMSCVGPPLQAPAMGASSPSTLPASQERPAATLAKIDEGSTVVALGSLALDQGSWTLPAVGMPLS